MTEAKITYRGVEVPEDVAYTMWSSHASAGFRAGVDAALDSPTITAMMARATEVPASAPVKDTYTELTDGEGDVWFELPGIEGRYSLWRSWKSRTDAGEYFAIRPLIASTRDEIAQAYGDIVSERQRTGDTK